MALPIDPAHDTDTGLVKLALSSSLISLSTITLGVPLLSLGLIRTLTPQAFSRINQTSDRIIFKLTDQWIANNNTIISQLLRNTHWQVDIDPELDLNTNGRYLIICNHQTWVDTTVTQYIGLDKMPLARFFTKWELLFIPFVGQAFKILGFPMMKRHSAEAIAKKPELKYQDLESARKACQRMLANPFSLLNYLEGTRFTAAKKTAQQSPFKNLLKPKYGGIALSFDILGQELDAFVDMTIVYPDGAPTYSWFWRGKTKRIIVQLKKIDIPSWIKKDQQNDPEYRQKFQQWIDQLWSEKDQRIQAIKQAAD